MVRISGDDRSAERRELDELIAAEPKTPLPDLPPGTTAAPVEYFLGQLHRPLAVAGIVENGVIRMLDPTVSFPEHTRVIIVASDPT